jgi:hypothetical protein
MRNLVGCLPIQLSRDLCLGLVVVQIAKRLQFASSEASAGRGNGSNFYGQSVARPLIDRRHNTLCA